MYDVYEDDVVKALFIAAGIGAVIAENASIAGASGGCQAEIGSASCMAAAAITYIRGGSTKQVFDAGAFALKSLLGLVCDPLGGLVEVPCIKRNVIGSVNAITASDMAMAGIESKVPLDEVIDAMAEVGDLLPCSLKETSQAGLAQTEMASKLGVPTFAVRNIVSCARAYSISELEQAVRDFVDAEESVKTGRLEDKLSVELLIIKYSSKKAAG